MTTGVSILVFVELALESDQVVEIVVASMFQSLFSWNLPLNRKLLIMRTHVSILVFVVSILVFVELALEFVELP